MSPNHDHSERHGDGKERRSDRPPAGCIRDARRPIPRAQRVRLDRRDRYTAGSPHRHHPTDTRRAGRRHHRPRRLGPHDPMDPPCSGVADSGDPVAGCVDPYDARRRRATVMLVQVERLADVDRIATTSYPAPPSPIASRQPLMPSGPSKVERLKTEINGMVIAASVEPRSADVKRGVQRARRR